MPEPDCQTILIVNVTGLNKPEQRAGIVYVGRPFAGWKGHALANPFKGPGALERYSEWLLSRPTLEADLAALWEETDRGRLPLGCWCTHGSVGVRHEPVVCHAQVLARELFWRFINART